MYHEVNDDPILQVSGQEPNVLQVPHGDQEFLTVKTMLEMWNLAYKLIITYQDDLGHQSGHHPPSLKSETINLLQVSHEWQGSRQTYNHSRKFELIIQPDNHISRWSVTPGKLGSDFGVS